MFFIGMSDTLADRNLPSGLVYPQERLRILRSNRAIIRSVAAGGRLFHQLIDRIIQPLIDAQKWRRPSAVCPKRRSSHKSQHPNQTIKLLRVHTTLSPLWRTKLNSVRA
jgi:hypothetical protein